jgi:hypothetical protein
MWLINTASLRLEPFDSSLDVKYAILSHTWEGGEVSFQEMQNPKESTKQKPGYRKIEATCNVTAHKGLEYAWVDTCCIDKSSSAELSEAINSMFRWYKDAEICFAYLSDLVLPISTSIDEDELVSYLSRCRWFSRGWTLQELIVPRSLELYDSSWNFRGSRDQFASQLSTITRVDVAVLQNSNVMNSLPVARRMSWASNRQTTREEDIAYCLLGIFDVNMALLYGEGSKAFVRLQDEIATQSGNISLFGWTAQKSTNENPPRSAETVRSDQYYRGVFALSPSEFATCGGFRFLPMHKRYNQVFSAAVRGFNIDALLVKGSEDGPCHILTLDISDERLQFLDVERLGIQLTKTLRGYVRSNPFKLPGVSRGAGRSCIKFFIPKQLSIQESNAIPDQFDGCICLRHFSDSLHGLAAVPMKLWDPRRLMFLTGEMYQGTKGPQDISTYMLFRFQPENQQPGIYFMVIRMCRPSWERPEGQLADMICIVKNESDKNWSELMTSMHLSDKYYAGDNLWYLRYCVLNEDFSPKNSSTYVDKAAGIKVTCTASLVTSSYGEGGPHQLGLNLDGPLVHYLDIHAQVDTITPQLLPQRQEDGVRKYQDEALGIALGYFFR